MVTDKIAQLKVLQAQAAELQLSIETERTRELLGLPAQYGFDSVESFIKAVRTASSSGKKRGRKASAKPATAGRRTRTKITPELKVAVKSAVEAGKTGAVIAAEFGISLPSVQNIKKEFGLVKVRGADATPPPIPASAQESAPAPAE